MLAIVKESTGRGEVSVREVADGRLKSDEVRVKISVSAICGTDLKIESGAYPWRSNPKWPLILGHEAAGRVVEAGSAVSRVPEGRVALLSIVNCGSCETCARGLPTACLRGTHIGINRDGALAESVIVPASVCFPTPEWLSDEACAMLEPLAIIAHTLERTALSREDSVAIVGPGPIGLLHLIAARGLGVSRISVFGTDRDHVRLAKAKSLGADEVVRWSGSDPSVIQPKHLGFDVVIEAAGTQAAVDLAFHIVRPFGRVVLKGLANGACSETLPIVRKSLTVAGEAGAVAKHYEQAIALARNSGIDPAAVLTHTVPIKDGAAAFRLMRDREGIVAIHG